MKNVGNKNARKATIKKAQSGPYYLDKERLKQASSIILPKPSPKDSEWIEHGPQSDDTIILSDSEIDDEGKIGDVAKEVAQRYVCVNEEKYWETANNGKRLQHLYYHETRKWRLF